MGAAALGRVGVCDDRKKEGSALQQRWTEFLGYSVPYLTRMVGMLITGTPPLSPPLPSPRL
jgi:hypothetical protein